MKDCGNDDKDARKGLPWDDLNEQWPDDGCGPDARVHYSYTVHSRTRHTDPARAVVPDDEVSTPYKTLDGAVKRWRLCISQREPQVVECDIRMELQFGGYYQTHRKDNVITPRINTVYIYLARWRRDGAYIESYHFNDARFGERDATAHHHELGAVRGMPGLMAHYVAEHERRKQEREQKKQKTQA